MGLESSILVQFFAGASDSSDFASRRNSCAFGISIKGIEAIEHRTIKLSILVEPRRFNSLLI